MTAGFFRQKEPELEVQLAELQRRAVAQGQQEVKLLVQAPRLLVLMLEGLAVAHRAAVEERLEGQASRTSPGTKPAPGPTLR